MLASPQVREVYLGSDLDTSVVEAVLDESGLETQRSEDRRSDVRTAPDAPVLEVRDLTVHHGQLKAISEVSLQVRAGEVYAMIGANGAGKSTLMRTIAGLHLPTSGTILLDGADVTRLRPEKRATAGISMVPEGRRLFPSLTLEENLKVGASYARKGPWNIPGHGTVPLHAGTPQAEDRADVRRRAADGRDQPGAGRQPPGAAA